MISPKKEGEVQGAQTVIGCVSQANPAIPLASELGLLAQQSSGLAESFHR